MPVLRRRRFLIRQKQKKKVERGKQIKKQNIQRYKEAIVLRNKSSDLLSRIKAVVKLAEQSPAEAEKILRDSNLFEQWCRLLSEHGNFLERYRALRKDALWEKIAEGERLANLMHTSLRQVMDSMGEFEKLEKFGLMKKDWHKRARLHSKQI